MLLILGDVSWGVSSGVNKVNEPEIISQQNSLIVVFVLNIIINILC